MIEIRAELKIKMAKQIIKLKTADVNRAVIRGLRHSVWEKKKSGNVAEKIHAHPKFKAPRYKKDFGAEV